MNSVKYPRKLYTFDNRLEIRVVFETYMKLLIKFVTKGYFSNLSKMTSLVTIYRLDVKLLLVQNLMLESPRDLSLSHYFLSYINDISDSLS